MSPDMEIPEEVERDLEARGQKYPGPEPDR